MLTTTQVWEDDPDGEYVLVTYRVRVCTHCGHEACPCCGGTWCDACFRDSVEGKELCADAQRCFYDEPDSEAVVEVSREIKSAEEFEAELRAAGLQIEASESPCEHGRISIPVGVLDKYDRTPAEQDAFVVEQRAVREEINNSFAANKSILLKADSRRGIWSTRAPSTDVCNNVDTDAEWVAFQELLGERHLYHAFDETGREMDRGRFRLTDSGRRLLNALLHH